MWQNFVDPESPQVTIWRKRIACWITKATDTHSECVIIITVLFHCTVVICTRLNVTSICTWTALLYLIFLEVHTNFVIPELPKTNQNSYV